VSECGYDTDGVGVSESRRRVLLGSGDVTEGARATPEADGGTGPGQWSFGHRTWVLVT
jgi:hypothetical protein